jgi:hypothetical protein
MRWGECGKLRFQVPLFAHLRLLEMLRWRLAGTMSWVLTQTGTTLSGTVSLSESLTSGDPNICGSTVSGTDTLQGSVTGSAVNLTGTQGETFTATVTGNTMTGTGTSGQNTFAYSLTQQQQYLSLSQLGPVRLGGKPDGTKSASRTATKVGDNFGAFEEQGFRW